MSIFAKIICSQKLYGYKKTDCEPRGNDGSADPFGTDKMSDVEADIKETLAQTARVSQ
jgi:hypothetical protein